MVSPPTPQALYVLASYRFGELTLFSCRLGPYYFGVMLNTFLYGVNISLNFPMSLAHIAIKILVLQVNLLISMYFHPLISFHKYRRSPTIKHLAKSRYMDCEVTVDILTSVLRDKTWLRFLVSRYGLALTH